MPPSPKGLEGLFYVRNYFIPDRQTVNEFYKKGSQEKSSALTGGWRFFLEIQPTLFRCF